MCLNDARAHLLLECCWRLPWPALPTLCWLHLVQCAQAGMSDRHLACTAQMLSQRLSDNLGPTEARRLHLNMRQWLLDHSKLWRLACTSTILPAAVMHRQLEDLTRSLW